MLRSTWRVFAALRSAVAKPSVCSNAHWGARTAKGLGHLPDACQAFRQRAENAGWRRTTPVSRSSLRALRVNRNPATTFTLEVTIDKTLDNIAHVRGLDRQRAAAERARTNLSRYFSPNLVEMLADRDEPLGLVRRETVAVLFVDIVGFTRMAETMTPESVVTCSANSMNGWRRRSSPAAGRSRNTLATRSSRCSGC
jgi:hypothetical protein